MSLSCLVLGTKNRKKARELVDLLAPLGFELKTLDEFPTALEIEETGDSFAANAALKAVGQARQLNRWVLGEDSGIVADALKGAPGIYSARYAGPSATDEQNNERLLNQLGKTPLEKRTAHYVCHVCLADPAGQVRAATEARCHGRIRFEPAGTGGFGYDPLFEIVEYHRTFGELGERIKELFSHRARAIELLVPKLLQLRASAG